MYNKQFGFIPTLVKYLGYAILIISLLMCVRVSIMVFRSVLPITDSSKLVLVILVAIGVPIFLLSPFILLGTIMTSVFPSLKIESRGIEYRFWPFKGLLKWEEIRNTLLLKGDFLALVIERRGFYFLNGLYFNRLHGLLFKIQDPILLISPKTENIDSIVEAINQNAKVDKSNPYVGKRWWHLF